MGQIENFYKINYETYDKREDDYLDGDKSYQEDLVSLRYEYRNKGESEKGEAARGDLKSIREEAAELRTTRTFLPYLYSVEDIRNITIKAGTFSTV